MGRASRLIALALVAACQRAIAPDRMMPAPAAEAPAAAPQTPYVSNLAGVVFGNAFARATADGAPATDDRSSGSDQPISVSASRDGEELKRSCGNDGSQSHAQATAAFQPMLVAGVRQFGFALSATAYAKGGAWRERFVLCRGAHNTAAVADARATGRVDLTFNPNGDASEELILRVSGATPEQAHLEVRDAEDRQLPLGSVPGETSVTTTLSRPGTYSVRASLATQARNGGGTSSAAQHAVNVAVSVQSRRDALAVGFGDAPMTAVVLPLPVFMSTDAMSAALDSALFTADHRFYPCARVDCPSDRLRNVYLEAPRVSTVGGSVVVDMRIGGSYQVGLIFGGAVSGTIRATAVPVVEHDTLRFESPSIDVASHNLIVKWRAASYERKLLDRIRNVRIDLGPRLQDAVGRAQEQFSQARGGACLLLAPREAHLQSVQVVTTAPQGIVANFGVALSEAPGGACQKGKTLR